MILIADYNIESNEATVFDFCQVYNTSNLIRYYISYKNSAIPSCIDLILTNKRKSFSRSAVIETGLLDFNKVTLLIMKTHFPKQMPNIIEYGDCDFKKFSSDLFR